MNRAIILALTLLVAGCGDQSAVPTEQGGAASGEVLPGSISDAMIPLDQIDSQAPLAPPQALPSGDVDGAQPEVTPAPGVESAPANEGAEAAPAAPAPDPAE
jgi:hypothetical protein